MGPSSVPGAPSRAALVAALVLVGAVAVGLSVALGSRGEIEIPESLWVRAARNPGGGDAIDLQAPRWTVPHAGVRPSPLTCWSLRNGGTGLLAEDAETPSDVEIHCLAHVPAGRGLLWARDERIVTYASTGRWQDERGTRWWELVRQRDGSFD